jgi:hypothetical protein
MKRIPKQILKVLQQLKNGDDPSPICHSGGQPVCRKFFRCGSEWSLDWPLQIQKHRRSRHRPEKKEKAIGIDLP